jgi:hypothetical protein
MANMIVAYPQQDKAKALTICNAFVAGVRACGGEARVAEGIPKRLEDGAGFFYGVRPAWSHLWEQAKAERREWIYCDNSYFDVSRESSFRVTREALQADGLQACWTGDGAARLKALGITVKDWRHNGSHIVVCPQSDEFLRVVAGYEGNWLADATAEIRKHTDRSLRIRKKGEPRPLVADLQGAWALVTHMSCAAVEALCAGVPVFCTGRCAAQWMGSSDLSMIETPYYPERRQEWAEVLATNQWTLSELADGTAWRALSGNRP